MISLISCFLHASYHVVMFIYVLGMYGDTTKQNDMAFTYYEKESLICSPNGYFTMPLKRCDPGTKLA